MQNHPFIRLLSAGLFLLFLTGALACSSSGDPKRKVFPLALREFNMALRWKNLEVARTYLAPEYAPKVNRMLRDTLGQIKISEVELVDLKVNPDGETAVAVVEFTWFLPNSLTVNKGVEYQKWKRIGKSWYIFVQNPPNKDDGEPSPFVD